MRWNFGMIFRYHGTTCNYCDCQNVLSIFSDCKNELKGVVVVAQLVEQLLPNTEVPSSNRVIGNILYWTFTVNSIEKKKIKKKRPGMAHFLKKVNFWSWRHVYRFEFVKQFWLSKLFGDGKQKPEKVLRIRMLRTSKFWKQNFDQICRQNIVHLCKPKWSHYKSILNHEDCLDMPSSFFAITGYRILQKIWCLKVMQRVNAKNSSSNFKLYNCASKKAMKPSSYGIEILDLLDVG